MQMDRVSRELPMLDDGVLSHWMEVRVAEKETRRTRQIRFESLLDVVDDFPLVSTVDAVLAFDRRMRKATSTLSRKQGDDLMQKWSARRLNVVAIRKANR